MAKESRANMFQRLAVLEKNRDDISESGLERIFASGGHETGEYSPDEALFRMALEIKIFRLKRKLGYIQ